MIASTNFGMPLGRMNLILRVVSAEFDVSLPDLLSHRRMRKIARPRQIACWLARHATMHSIPQIGNRLGDRDHTTILHAISRVDEIRSRDTAFREKTDQVLARVRAVCAGVPEDRSAVRTRELGAITA